MDEIIEKEQKQTLQEIMDSDIEIKIGRNHYPVDIARILLNLGVVVKYEPFSNRNSYAILTLSNDSKVLLIDSDLIENRFINLYSIMIMASIIARRLHRGTYHIEDSMFDLNYKLLQGNLLGAYLYKVMSDDLFTAISEITGNDRELLAEYFYLPVGHVITKSKILNLHDNSYTRLQLFGHKLCQMAGGIYISLLNILQRR